MNAQILISFGAYFSILLIIGLLAHRKSTSEEDFVLGGRGLNYWVTALSAHASDMSSWLFMAFPMAIFVGGLPKCWIALGLLLGMFLNWQFIAPRLRVLTEEYDCYTVASFFEKRFNDPSGTIRFVSALMTLTFMLHYLAAGLTGMGFIFENLFFVNYYLGISIASIIIVLYTALGGFVTVAWTDLFQGVFLLAVLIAVPFFALNSLGGWDAVTMAAQTKQLSLSLWPEKPIQLFFLVFGWGLGYFGQLHIISKFMGIKNASELKKSKWVGMTWQFFALSAATLVGLVGIAFFPETLGNPELVFVAMVKQLFSPILAGFILCAILAATISTMDSQILVAAGVLTEDIYRLVRKFLGKTDDNLLGKSRISVVLTTFVAYIIALDKNASVMETVTYSWTGLGCSFGPLLLFACYFKPTNKYGAIAGILTGGLIALFWGSLNQSFLHSEIPAMIPGFAAASLAIYATSKLTQS